MIITVSNFGKINKAKIILGGYTLFVGKNNSGKTYLMQLIYGVIAFLSKKIFNNFVYDENVKLLFNSSRIEITDKNFDVIEAAINRTLEKNLNSIVSDVFRTLSLPIGAVTVSFSDCINKSYVIEKNKKKNSIADDNETKYIYYDIKSNNKLINTAGFKEENSVFVSYVIQNIIYDMVFNGMHYDLRNTNTACIFLPVSRSGLSLVYNDLFANSSSSIENAEIENDGDNSDNHSLTTPIWDFMKYLLKYKYSDVLAHKNEELIKFMNSNILRGSLKKIENTMFYHDDDKNIDIPAYLVSSMVNELSPIAQILTGSNEFKYIFYDEIETCQHPMTQIQMARLVNRMVNAGYNMIVSTHSDSMATAIDNLALLSYMKDKKEKNKRIKICNYEEEDLLIPNKLYVYEFIENENGTDVVQCDERHNLNMGYKFTQFNESNMKLYNDAVIIRKGVANE